MRLAQDIWTDWDGATPISYIWLDITVEGRTHTEIQWEL